MNPLKCAFGVTSGRFLGFIVHHRGIEIDQSKIKAIQEMPESKNLRELSGFKVAWHTSEDSSQILKDVATPSATS